MSYWMKELLEYMTDTDKSPDFIVLVPFSSYLIVEKIGIGGGFTPAQDTHRLTVTVAAAVSFPYT